MKVKNSPVAGPTSSAGLVRYFDTVGDGVQITPEMVLGFAVFFLVAEAIIGFVL